ncbi:hypothetical protein X777_02192, partial [Ooceraea biroi]
FLQDELPAKFEKFKFFFTDVDSFCKLALITDMTNHLNILNLKLQKTNQIISQLVCHVDSFRKKLVLFKTQLENNNNSVLRRCLACIDVQGQHFEMRH